MNGVNDNVHSTFLKPDYKFIRFVTLSRCFETRGVIYAVGIHDAQYTKQFTNIWRNILDDLDL